MKGRNYTRLNFSLCCIFLQRNANVAFRRYRIQRKISLLSVSRELFTSFIRDRAIKVDGATNGRVDPEA